MKIDGKVIAQTIFQELQADVVRLKSNHVVPHLVVILIGNDPASEAYVSQKKKRGEEIGMIVSVANYGTDVTTEEVLGAIRHLNKQDDVHGIIVQQPVPKHIAIKKITEMTDPKKDVDGFHEKSVFTPPIAEAAIEVLKHATKSQDFSEWIKKQYIIVIGKGETGGTPIMQKLQSLGLHPTNIDSKTPNPKELTKKADIIISCVGKANILTKNMIKKGVILLSIGMFRGDDGKLHGDYDEADIKDTAGFYTPVPGGAGPVNVAMLLKNVIKAASENK